ncbi:sigma-70 family RNA polymerase sigma factor [Pseudomonas sp. ZM23]|uniref:Sigma-70 family RNA polymerase sigma factor n=1 Tax=Pseudomonas triclosanedens TaxID=2961893 RepID=A0ABY6ZS13_9PSED|nr:sigma-70 family RNA polymerase sigma factor [Pseudomonas triclosanedens]MCP8467070.1 sigma-70 family RNA polymerase sigma factor [Pseudomonas triclosanedens]MCP8472781.1 sigma-70 family RNA polymerase sigma factor [Pseudomonas triclosanedens]MCP8478212.1 sigma-70 family RNA polymerase sigma factor [Pseudomonas triclosanedens]WAI47618.1 sigma-70 family RNA polymerase sigma factor [Pseudomonas triclosanedens]
MSGVDKSHGHYVGLLFRQHYDWLQGRLRRHTDSTASAEDLAAETFLQLLVRPAPDPIREPRALLTTIARRLLFQLWRRRDLERAYLDTLDPDAADERSPEQIAELLEALQRIDQLLDGLPLKVKATFLLSQVDGLTYPEIARALGISQRSVSDYMARALQRCLKVSLS